MFIKIMYSDRYILKNYSKFVSGPQLMLVVKCPSGSTLIYSHSMHTTLLEGWDLSTSMVLQLLSIISYSWPVTFGILFVKSQ
jgi:hypothetical protein